MHYIRTHYYYYYYYYYYSSPSQGLNSGFAGGEDESYNVYSEPWRKDQNVANSLYRPGKNADKDVYGDDLEALIKQKRSV